jgi:hypothetical protein
MAFVTAFFVTPFIAVIIEGLPDSVFQIFGVTFLFAILLGVIVLTGAFLRTRVIMDDAGVTLVWAFRRYRLAWSEIKEITIVDSGFQFWKVQVRSAEREHLAFLFPTWLPGGGAATEERFHEPPPHSPRALRKLCTELRDEWKRHRKAGQG